MGPDVKVGHKSYPYYYPYKTARTGFEARGSTIRQQAVGLSSPMDFRCGGRGICNGMPEFDLDLPGDDAGCMWCLPPKVFWDALVRNKFQSMWFVTEYYVSYWLRRNWKLTAFPVTYCAKPH